MGGNGWARGGVTLHAEDASTQLLTGYLDTLTRGLPNLSATSISAARNATLELLIGAMRPESGASSSSTSGPVLREAMDRFIAKHLLDEFLSPSTIANAHGVSVRTVNRIFSATGGTDKDTVRTRRLARAPNELTESDWSIAAIASRWQSRTAAT
jgi:AraC-like DNA-binding protein